MSPTFRRSLAQYLGIFRGQRAGPPTARLGLAVGFRVEAQESNNQALRFRQLGHQDLSRPLTDSNLVALDRREHFNHPMRRGA